MAPTSKEAGATDAKVVGVPVAGAAGALARNGLERVQVIAYRSSSPTT